MEEFNFEKLIKDIRTYKPAYGMSAGDYICSEFCKSIIKMLMNLEVKAGRVNFYKFDRRKAKLRQIREKILGIGYFECPTHSECNDVEIDGKHYELWYEFKEDATIFDVNCGIIQPLAYNLRDVESFYNYLRIEKAYKKNDQK